MIPPLDPRGLLPPGLHDTDLETIPPLFCTNSHRHRLWDLAVEGLDILCQLLREHACDPPPTLVLAGSFFSDKAAPADIEATLVFPPTMPAAVGWFWTLVHLGPDRAMLKDVHGLDFYPSLPGLGNNDFSEFFQYVGPKTAQAKGLHEKDPRGALRISPW